MKERKNALEDLNKLYQMSEKMRKEYLQETNETTKSYLSELMDRCSRDIDKIKEEIEKELPFRNPESFLAHLF